MVDSADAYEPVEICCLFDVWSFAGALCIGLSQRALGEALMSLDTDWLLTPLIIATEVFIVAFVLWWWVGPPPGAGG